ncbi:transposase [Streptomyces malaysiensis]|uniref:transposase n=1 Tax=Streptomyces malaysiensis TaxID=92644 RepID=UPI00322093BD|nr:transposase [Streptomyces malaysiensis]
MLSEFRDRLIAHGLEQQILDAILAQCNKRGLLRAGGRARTDSTYVIACIRDLNRMEFVTETMRCALEALAVAAPAWLAGTDAVNADWLARYRQRADSYRLPKGEAERTAFAENVGGDGYELLDTLDDPTAPAHLAGLEAVVLLRTVWAQEYQRDARGVRWRGNKQRPPGAARIVSPHDPEARCGVKRGSAWDGYKTHLTESCDDGLPHLITHVVTTPATTDDHQLTNAVHQALTERGLKPAEHYVDSGYTSAKIILQARAQGIEVIGPVKQAGGRPALHRSGYAATDFRIDWQARQATLCLPRIHPPWSEACTGPHSRRPRSLEPALSRSCRQRAMMIDRAATTGLPWCDECVRGAASAADERPGQRCRDSRPAPSDRGPGTPTRQEKGPVQLKRPGVPGGAVAPAAVTHPAACATARAS